jgi:hypothetical protein
MNSMFHASDPPGFLLASRQERDRAIFDEVGFYRISPGLMRQEIETRNVPYPISLKALHHSALCIIPACACGSRGPSRRPS